MSTNLFQNFWGYISIQNLQITTHCSVFDRFCFRVLFAYFDESMASIGDSEPYRSWNTVGLTPK